MNRTLLACAGLSLLGASGCAYDPTYVEEDFGSSVRQMVAAQIADPDTATNPSPDGPQILDGVTAEESVLGYRSDAKREEAEEPSITFSID